MKRFFHKYFRSNNSLLSALTFFALKVELRDDVDDERLKKKRVSVCHDAPSSASNSDATRDTPSECTCTFRSETARE